MGWGRVEWSGRKSSEIERAGMETANFPLVTDSSVSTYILFQSVLLVIS